MSTSSNSGNSTSLYGEAGTPIPDSSGNVIVRGDLYVLSGNILTTAATGNIFPANATTINLGLAATAVNIGAASGTTTINNALTAGGTVTAPGADFGNITIGVATDNTITTTSGDLDITATGANGVNITSGSDAPTVITRNSTATNSAIRTLTINAQSTGTPAAGFGNSLEYEVETAVGNTERAAFISVTSTDVTPGSEDFRMDFGLMTAGAVADVKMGLDNTGKLSIDGDLTVGGVNINMAPSTNFLYSESDNRTNRPEFQSTSGNSSGLRVRAPNTGTSASSTFSVNNSSDSANTEFIALQARGSALGTTFRFLTGEYIANVLSASNKSISFTDYTNTYATVNPAGPTIGTDLTTKTYVDALVAGSGVTSITGTANQVIASSPTGAVTLSLPQSIATTSNPVFAGATLGNITVGVSDNQTITTTSGDLNITAAAASSVNITSETNAPTLITRNSTATTGSIRSLALNVQSSGTPTVGFGNNLEWQLETAPGNTESAGFISVVSTDLTAAAEDFKMSFGLMQAGAAYSERASLSSAGDLVLNGDLTVNSAITNSSGDLDITAVGNNTVNITSGSVGPTLITRNSSTTNTNIRSLGLNSQSSGTPATGIGNSIEFNVETAVGNTEAGGYLSVTSTDITPGSEDFKMSFGLMEAGATYAEKAFIDSAGNMTLDGDLTVNDAVVFTGSSSGSSTFAAPATGSTLSYVLPGASGAANTVLTNNGSGTLSWALPGGGGSTFGNVTVGVDSDQTISTTSGNLVLQTAAGVDAGTMTMTAGTNGNITLAPNGTGNVVNTFSNGGNLTNNRNYVFGAIRNATTAAAGNVWNFNTTGDVGPTRGISLDNSGDTTKNIGMILRTYSGSAASGQRPRLTFEKARNTVASPSANQAADVLGGIEATGYSSTGWVNDTIPAAPGNLVFVCNEAWTSNTNLGTGVVLNLAPTATTISTAANLVQAWNMNPQLNQSRSDAFTWGNGKSATTFSATGSSISGTTLTIGTVTAGTVQVGQFVQTATLGVLAGTYIVSNISGSGSGSTWVVSQTQTVGSATFTGTSGAMELDSSGNLDVFGGIIARGSSIQGVSLGTTYANITSGSSTFTNNGINNFIRTGSTAAQVPAVLVRYQRTDQTGAQDNDGVDFRLSVGGTSTSANIARFDAVYKSSGLNEIGMSVSTDSFSADTDRIYVGTRESTKIRTTPSGGGTVADTAEFTQLATTIKSDAVTLQTAAGAALPSGKISYGRQYIEAFSSVSQTNPVANAENLMAFENTGISNGVSIVTNGTALTRITFANAGIYNLQFSAQLSQTSGGGDNAFIWLKKNGANVASTAGDTRVAGNGDRIMAAWNYVFSAAAGDYYELAWSATDTSVILEAVAASAPVPAVPSVILTVVPVGA